MMAVLEFNVLIQLALESIDLLPKDVNRQRVKKAANDFIRAAEPIVDKQYLKMFETDEEVTQNLSAEISVLVKQIATYSFPKKIEMTQMWEAYSLEKENLIEYCHKIIKKHLQ